MSLSYDFIFSITLTVIATTPGDANGLTFWPAQQINWYETSSSSLSFHSLGPGRAGSPWANWPWRAFSISPTNLEILTFWPFDNLKIWQFDIVDHLALLTIWQFNIVDNFTLLTILHCWQFYIVENFTLLTILHCWQFDIVDNLTLLTIWHG